MNKYMDDFNRDKWKMSRWAKYTAFSLIAGVFMVFVLGWLFLIPAAVVAVLAYGLVTYMRYRKNRITVTIKETAAMKAIARREEDLKKEKERIMHEEYSIR